MSFGQILGKLSKYRCCTFFIPVLVKISFHFMVQVDHQVGRTENGSMVVPGTIFHQLHRPEGHHCLRCRRSHRHLLQNFTTVRYLFIFAVLEVQYSIHFLASGSVFSIPSLVRYPDKMLSVRSSVKLKTEIK
jgi:hypothetical protein